MKSFTGAAGTGKTTRLMMEVDGWLTNNEPGEDEYVLALTRMHGSRRRLVERLRSSAAHRRFQCMTLDRFAWIVASRWRALMRVRGTPLFTGLDYETTAATAAAVLALAPANAWIRARYPLIVVDELQDCRGGQLAMVQALAAGPGELFVAADGFQDLSGEGDAPAVSWLEQLEGVEELTEIHRTDKPALLAAALALRTGQPVQKGKGLAILSAMSAEVAAKFLANQICWARGEELVVLSPTGPDSSTFVHTVLERVGSKPFKQDDREIGPYNVAWQGPMKSRIEALCAGLALPGDDAAVIDLASLARIDSEDGRAIEEWVHRKRRLGKTHIPAGNLRAACHRYVQQSRSWALSPRGVWGTTIHGAKNREFEHVVILWPYEAPKDEVAARLLYNGISRAKKDAVVIIQDPNKERVNQPPFSGRAHPATPPTTPTSQLSFPGFGR